MILLGLRPGQASVAVDAIFGTGLLGFSVLEALQTRSPRALVELPFDWRNPAGRPLQLRVIEDSVRRELRAGARLNVLWSAGHAGFMSGEEATDAELRSFVEVLAMTERLARDHPRSSFHLISSAGGLYEGQRHVTLQSRPRPRRAYGQLKLRQEELLEASVAPLARHVYRVTSVYGYARPRFRAGLVATLILNAARRMVTHLTGRMDTLRDFIFVADVASFIAGRLLDGSGDRDSMSLLARARPCSLLEVQHLLEETIGRKLQVSYGVGEENGEDITFAPTTAPPGWRPSDLRANVGMIYRDALCNGATAPHFGPPEGAL